MNDERNTRSTDPACRWCLSPMTTGAVVCPACTRHQSRFWNTAPNISLLFALVAATFSGALFIYAQSARIVAEATWHDEVVIWKLDSTGKSFVRNVGDGDVFVSHIEFSGAPVTYTLEVRRVVKYGAMEEIESKLIPLPGQSFRPLSRQDIEDGVVPTHHVYLSENAATLVTWRQLMASAGKTLAETTAKAAVEYHSLKNSASGRSEADCTAVPLLFGG